MNKKIILIIVYIITNQSLYEQLSPLSKQRAAAGRTEEMVCQKCDLPSSLFNSTVSHCFLPPPSTGMGWAVFPLKCFLCKGRGTLNTGRSSSPLFQETPGQSLVTLICLLVVRMVTPPEGQPWGHPLSGSQESEVHVRMNSLGPRRLPGLYGKEAGARRLCLHPIRQVADIL